MAELIFLLIETITDTPMQKQHYLQYKRSFEERNIEIPIMISGTITDASGRILSGQDCRGFPDIGLCMYHYLVLDFN